MQTDMSEMSNEAIQSQIEANRIKAARIREGEGVLNSAGSAVTASKVLYADSSSNLASGALPFELEVTAANDTTFTFLRLTGRSSLSDDQLLSGTLVQGAQVTTWTATGYVQVNITDNGGNITDGVHYIQVGTIT